MAFLLIEDGLLFPFAIGFTTVSIRLAAIAVGFAAVATTIAAIGLVATAIAVRLYGRLLIVIHNHGIAAAVVCRMVRVVWILVPAFVLSVVFPDGSRGHRTVVDQNGRPAGTGRLAD